MKLIRHPNVIRMFEVMASKTKIYIVMEFVTGGELFEKIASRGRLKEDEYCSGDLSPPEFAHYGLAAPLFTHFTSLIRRYADVMVHRLLAASLGIFKLPNVFQRQILQRC